MGRGAAGRGRPGSGGAPAAGLTRGRTRGRAAGAGGRLRSDIDDPQELRKARIRQALIAGAVTAVVGGLVITFAGGDFSMLVQGPVFGPAGGAVGGIWGAGHPREAGPAAAGTSGFSSSSPESARTA